MKDKISNETAKMFKASALDIWKISQLWKFGKPDSIKILCTSDFLLARSYMYIILAVTYDVCWFSLTISTHFVLCLLWENYGWSI